jgi:hypothetical protein
MRSIYGSSRIYNSKSARYFEISIFLHVSRTLNCVIPHAVFGVLYFGTGNWEKTQSYIRMLFKIFILCETDGYQGWLRFPFSLCLSWALEAKKRSWTDITVVAIAA